MQKKTWGAISQFNWDGGNTVARAGGKTQNMSIFSADQLGFVGLKFDPLPSRTSIVISAVPVDCVVVFLNQIRAGGRWQKVPVVSAHAKSRNGRKSRGKLRNKARWRANLVITPSPFQDYITYAGLNPG